MNTIKTSVVRFADYARPRSAFSRVPSSVKLTAFAAGIGIAPIVTLGTFLGYETAGLVKESKSTITTSFSKMSFASRLAGTTSLALGTILFTGLKFGMIAQNTFLQAVAVLSTGLGLITLLTEKIVRSIKTWLTVRSIAKEIKTEEDKSQLRSALTELDPNIAQSLTTKLSKKGVVI